MRMHYDNPQHAAALVRLNEAWIAEYFELEEDDLALVRDPLRLVRDGAALLTLTDRGEVIGGGVLVPEEPGVVLLARMAVAAPERGKGWGRILLAAALQRAQALGAGRVRLFSNTRLAAAIHLYRAHGFEVVARGPHPRYRRCDIVMECRLPQLDASAPAGEGSRPGIPEGDAVSVEGRP